MKIEGKNNVVINLYKQNIITKNENKEALKGSDRVELSKLGKEISKYVDDYTKTETVNAKIDKIKEDIKNGLYKVDSEKLAMAIIDHIKKEI